VKLAIYSQFRGRGGVDGNTMGSHLGGDGTSHAGDSAAAEGILRKWLPTHPVNFQGQNKRLNAETTQQTSRQA